MNRFFLFLCISMLLLSGCSSKDRLDSSGAEPVWPDYAIVTEAPPPLPTAPEDPSLPVFSSPTEDTEPEPIEPRSTEPEAAEPRSAAPEPTEPRSTKPEPTEAASPDTHSVLTPRAVSAAPRSIPEETAEATQPVQTSGLRETTFTLSDGSSRKCLFYTPGSDCSGLGLIVYLHGGSGKGEDLSLITQAEGFPSYLQSGQLGSPNACVLIPQLPATYRGWSDMDGVLMQLISAAVREYDLDSANVSLTGHSMGGTGVWAIAVAHPGTFARIAPLSGSIRKTDENLEALKWVPVYAFVGDADTIVPPESSEEFISALQDQGSNARIEILEGADHFAVPGLAYLGGYGLVDWLIGN